ncbi:MULTISPECIES: EYxxD motif small membrane protein [Brevibacillus]|nr:EYxxD motif small membrane protein [Brevibacillus sp. HB2.2]
MLVGSQMYEWMSHNFFVVATIIGVIGVMGYYFFRTSRKRGRYRQ